ncbi:hypothetical protein V5799_016938 [Amblyomma americanum]|uniref:SP-RING-type domain-containing protein n=1 Tax=Amblyomma americanum TaxID=6943 RepID=A0AAQ4F3N8_AMBAM
MFLPTYTSCGVQVSLDCPLAQRRVNIPCRRVRCGHVQCFDVYSYLGCHEATLEPSWCCPVCREKVFVQDIRVDVFTLNILIRAGARFNAVEIRADGSCEFLTSGDDRNSFHVPCFLVLCARLFLTSPAVAGYALTRAFQCFTQSARKTLQAVFQADMSGPGVSATCGARYSPACGLLCLPDVFRMRELRLCRTRHITRTCTLLVTAQGTLGSVDVFPAQLRPRREGVVPDAYLFHMLARQIPCAVPKAPVTSSMH